MNEPLPCLGVRRPSGGHRLAAQAEARVVRAELERRVGALTIDLRIDGERLAAWQPVAHAAWPSGVDAVVDAGELFGADLPPLTALFARTVDPLAAEVRAAMLTHLGLRCERFGDRELADLDALHPTPTDLWLLVSSADPVTVTDRAVAGFADRSNASAAALDAAFDTIAGRLAGAAPFAAAAGRTLERLRAERDALRAELDGLRTELGRERSESAALVDRLAARLADHELGTSS